MSEAYIPKAGNLRSILLGLIPSIFIDAVLPFVVYTLLRPHTTEFLALLASAVPPTISNIVSIVRHRQVDAFGAIILLGIIISIIAIFFGGDPRLLLVRESLVTLGLGIACLISLFFPKPLMFYISKHFATGGDPRKAAGFDALWQYAIFRTMSYRITILWGIAFLAEFAVKVYLVYTLTIPQALVITPIVFNTTLVLLIIWTTLYSARVARRGRELREQQQAASAQ